MTLWIRSQNKAHLLSVDNLYVEKGKDKNKNDIWLICSNHDTKAYSLGEYKTPERANEILDDIQKLVNGDLILFTNIEVSGDIGDYLKPSKAIMYNDKTDKPKIEYAHRDCVVYEMPQK